METRIMGRTEGRNRVRTGFLKQKRRKLLEK
jgi:hypothetical protein